MNVCSTCNIPRDATQLRHYQWCDLASNDKLDMDEHTICEECISHHIATSPHPREIMCGICITKTKTTTRWIVSLYDIEVEDVLRASGNND